MYTESPVRNFFGPLAGANALIMDLDGVCYNMVQEFTDWVSHTAQNVKLPDENFVPANYNFWSHWGMDNDWFRQVFPLFLVQSGLCDPRYTLHGSTGMGAWRYANTHGIPVYVATARDFGQAEPDLPILEWMWKEGLTSHAVVVTEPGQSKADTLIEFFPELLENPHRVIALEDTIDNAVDYLGRGFNSFLVDRPWNVQTKGPFKSSSPSVVFDSQWVLEQVGEVQVP